VARLHVWIAGVVQGVFFRDSTRREADRLGLVGWVKNLPDGRVEAVFEGDRKNCEKALDFVKVGPPTAHVSVVEKKWEKEEGTADRFRIVF
jgi:acylphosphatase